MLHGEERPSSEEIKAQHTLHHKITIDEGGGRYWKHEKKRKDRKFEVRRQRYKKRERRLKISDSKASSAMH